MMWLSEWEGSVQNDPEERLKVVFLTGAGVSAESGLSTFRDSGGLWEGHNVHDVASPDGWAADPAMVLKFYNLRRSAAATAQPNEAHRSLAQLEKKCSVVVITQNVDDLHERGGSSRVLHLHGRLNEARSVQDENLVYEIGSKELKLGDLAEDGGQLRPNIVWFGEDVPMISVAQEFARLADIFIVVGTSLEVYPAAGLLQYCPEHAQKFLVDPKPPAGLRGRGMEGLEFVRASATVGVSQIVEAMMED